jgi:hypothetical protein
MPYFLYIVFTVILIYVALKCINYISKKEAKK